MYLASLSRVGGILLTRRTKFTPCCSPQMFHPLCFLIVSFIYIVPLFIFVLEHQIHVVVYLHTTYESNPSVNSWLQTSGSETDPDIATTTKLSTNRFYDRYNLEFDLRKRFYDRYTRFADDNGTVEGK